MPLPALMAACMALGFQTPPRPTPYTEELKQLAAADQADRQFKGQPSEAETNLMKENDPKRLARVREIIGEAEELNAEDFDHAAVLFQHGVTPDDFLTAHELSVCAGMLGRISSMPALAEDRYLTTLNRPQRFGTQFHWVAGKVGLNPVDETPPTAVTDDLRLDMVVPPLNLSRKLGIGANAAAQNQVFKRLEQRHNPAKPPKANFKISQELQNLLSDASGRKRALELYNKGRLISDVDLRNAARILAGSKDSNDLILAHELAMLALVEGDRPSGRLFESTWDSFALSIGQPARYASGTQCRAVRRVLESS